MVGVWRILVSVGTVTARLPAVLLLLIYLGYISLGLPDGSFGVAWPRAHRDLGLPIGMAGIVVVVALLLAAVAGFSSARIIARWNTAPLVAVSCLLTSSGLLLISQAQGLAWLIAAAIPLGLGAGAVDAALNGFVARHYAARHMNWLHACWGIGAAGGPLVLAQTMAGGWGWRGGFLVLAGLQFSLALLFFGTLRLWSQVPDRPFSSGGAAEAESPNGAKATADSFAGWLSAAIFVLYVAAEGTTGVWAGSILVESRGFPAPVAGVCAAGFYGAITVGRFSAGFIVERWGNRRIVNAGGCVAGAGALLFLVAQTPWLAGTALALMGLGFAPMYPCLMHEVPRRFAPEAVQTIIGRQSGSGAFGNATLPAAAGLLAQSSLELIPWVVIATYAVLMLAIRQLNRIT